MEKLVMRRSCCKCGCSVHICAIINILVSLLLSGLVFVASIFDLLEQKEGADYRNAILEIVMKYDTNDMFTDFRAKTLSAQLTIAMITTSAVAFLFGLCALFGIVMRKKYFVIPWLVFNGVSVIGLTFLFIIFSIAFPLGLVMLIVVVPYAYIYIVGHSFFFRLAAAETLDDPV